MTGAIDLGVHALRAAYTSGSLSVGRTMEEVLGRIASAGDDKVWIARVPDSDLRSQAATLDGRHDELARLPLYGIPFAVKDNIDVVGLATTAACPGFAYKPERSAEAVRRLVEAGALFVGKTNLDQFATGLVGVRSPYGVPRNPFNPAVIPGGSSSGSAVAVAAGIVPLALGTDTAGSGRVPAGLNNIVGLKPSLGLVSTAGVVPACRTLDCVSVFALTTDDAWTAFQVMAGPDRADPYSRERPPGEPGDMPTVIRLGVPRKSQRLFFGDREYEAAYTAALERLERLGCSVVEVDFEPFYETARLLYEGPWVAERTLAAGALIS